MLGSITPLGERGRGSRWWLTVTAYVAGSVLGGAAIGGALGGVGGLIPWEPSVAARLVAVGAVTIVGLALDLGVGGRRLPSIRRQVEEEWRQRYRGWVWGVGFGLQLGVGVVTIVTTSTVYVTWLAAALSGGIAAGAAIGSVFGLARALPVFSVARVRRPAQLLRVDATLRTLARPARRLAATASIVIAAASIAGAVRG